MAETPDPFAHHPDLRDKIEDPAVATFYRNFSVATLFADKPDHHWVLEVRHGDETREALRRAALAGHPGGDLRVFGYGSLMWNPAFHFAEVRWATLAGHARRFILKDVFGGRGTREAPSLMAALDGGLLCDGLAFRIAQKDIETEILWRRVCVAPGYVAALVTAHIDGAPLQAPTFLADHAAEAIQPDLSFDQQVHLIATGTGLLGSSRDNLASIVAHVAPLDIHDEDCAALLAEVDRHLAGSD